MIIITIDLYLICSFLAILFHAVTHFCNFPKNPADIGIKFYNYKPSICANVIAYS